MTTAPMIDFLSVQKEIACKYISRFQMKVILKLLVKGQKCHVWCVNKIYPADNLNTTTPSANAALRKSYSAKRPPLGPKRETNSETSIHLSISFPRP
jgi:hypothetical protein